MKIINKTRQPPSFPFIELSYSSLYRGGIHFFPFLCFLLRNNQSAISAAFSSLKKLPRPVPPRRQSDHIAAFLLLSIKVLENMRSIDQKGAVLISRIRGVEEI
jgi:hypothetical protein